MRRYFGKYLLVVIALFGIHLVFPYEYVAKKIVHWSMEYAAKEMVGMAPGGDLLVKSVTGMTDPLKGEELDKLLRAASDIKSVKVTDGEIVIERHSGEPTPIPSPFPKDLFGFDERIARQAEALLRAHEKTADLPLVLEVEKGVITVSGPVPDRLTQVTIDLTLQELSGVRYIVDKTVIDR